MELTRRLALVISILICGSLALAAAVAAAGGGGGLGPGSYSFVNTTAGAQFGTFGDPTQPPNGFAVFVDKGLNSFQPKKSQPQVSESTIVNLDIFGPNGGGSFCFVLSDPSQFQVSSNLQSASLHALLRAEDQCTFGGPVTGSARHAPFAGGGAPGLQPPFQVDVTWTGTGVTGSGKDRGTFKCGDYSTKTSNEQRTAGETSTGQIAGIFGSTASTTAGVLANATHLDISGFPKQGCFGF